MGYLKSLSLSLSLSHTHTHSLSLSRVFLVCCVFGVLFVRLPLCLCVVLTAQVDDQVPGGGRFTVYSSAKETFDVMLNQTNIGQNNNKYNPLTHHACTHTLMHSCTHGHALPSMHFLALSTLFLLLSLPPLFSLTSDTT